jgi:hypothetical protein
MKIAAVLMKNGADPLGLDDSPGSYIVHKTQKSER